MTLSGVWTALAQAQPVAITLRVSSETAPAGGWAQFKIFAAQPIEAGSGILSMDFDPTVFGDVSQVAVFSAFGDIGGYANVSGQHVDAHFDAVRANSGGFLSPNGSAGQLPELPIAIVTIAIRAGLAPGTKTPVTLNSANTILSTNQRFPDPQFPIPITVAPGEFTVGGSLAVKSISPGYGLVPAGTMLKIQGTGFSSATTVTVDGVSLSAVQLVSPQQINVTVGGATELMGRHFRVSDGSSAVDFYSAPPSAPSPPPAGFVPLADVQPLFPLTMPFTTSESGDYLGYNTGTQAYALLNENSSAVTVTIQGVNQGLITLPAPQTLVIPPYSLYVIDVTGTVEQLFWYWIRASMPIQMLTLVHLMPFGPPPPANTPEYSVTPMTPVAAGTESLALQFGGVYSWNWQQGTPVPASYTAPLSGGLDFQVSVSPASSWLSVTPTSGTAPANLTLTPNVAGLKPGSYHLMVSVTPVLPLTLAGVTAQPSTADVYLTVSAGPMLNWGGGSNAFFVTAGSGPVTSMLTVGTNGTGAAFTIKAGTSSGGNWLAVSPLTGSTPATLTITATPGQLPAGTYNGSITILSPQDKLIIPITLTISAVEPAVLTANPTSLSFVMESGTAAPYVQTVTFGPLPAYIASPVSSAGWLTTMVEFYGPNPAVDVGASAVGLAPGTYKGTLTVNSTSGSGSVMVPVTLTVTAAPAAQTPLMASPASLTLSVPAGENANASFSVTSGGVPIFFTVTNTGPAPIGATVNGVCSYDGRCATPATVNVQGGGMQLGTFMGDVVVQWDTGSLSVPVTVKVTNGVSPAPPGPMYLTQVLNGASFASGPLAPGEIITVLGTSIGPYATGLEIGADGKVARSLNGTQLLINGIAAPLLYASPNQLNAIVPYEVGTSGTATVQVMANGQQSAVWGVPLTPSAPGIFALNAPGVGQGAVLNQDNSVNGPANPAARNSVIQIFATGEGLTSPAGVTGSITQNNLNKPVLPVSVLIGGVEAALEYDGSAPDAVEGLLQVNAIVPVGAPSGPVVPIVLKIGDQPSANGVTVAVE